MIERLLYTFVIRSRKLDRERMVFRCEILNLFSLIFIYVVIYYYGHINFIEILTQLFIFLSITIIFLEIWALTDDSFTFGLLSLFNYQKVSIKDITKIDKIFSKDKLNERRLTNIKLGILKDQPDAEISLTKKGQFIRKILFKLSALLGIRNNNG